MNFLENYWPLVFIGVAYFILAAIRRSVGDKVDESDLNIKNRVLIILMGIALLLIPLLTYIFHDENEIKFVTLMDIVLGSFILILSFVVLMLGIFSRGEKFLSFLNWITRKQR